MRLQRCEFQGRVVEMRIVYLMLYQKCIEMKTKTGSSEDTRLIISKDIFH